MSRSSNGSKRPGYEYQGKRPFNNVTPSRKNKRITHKIERAKDKQTLQQMANDGQKDR